MADEKTDSGDVAAVDLASVGAQTVEETGEVNTVEEIMEATGVDRVTAEMIHGMETGEISELGDLEIVE